MRSETCRSGAARCERIAELEAALSVLSEPCLGLTVLGARVDRLWLAEDLRDAAPSALRGDRCGCVEVFRTVDRAIV
jgi:hypothetical protein